MTGATPAVAQLSGLTTEQQLVVTAATLVALAVAWLAVEAASERLRGTLGDRTIETIEVIAFTGLVGGATAILVLVWEAVGPLQNRVGEVLTNDQAGPNIVVSVLLLATAYGLTRVVRRIINRSRVADVSTDHRREVAYHVVQVTVYTISLLLVLAVWRVNIGNLLLGAGVLGVVLGLAARETLGAVIAGFVLLFARPFSVGDWVEIHDREGLVQDITIVNTRLRTFDGEQVMIPNDQVTGEEIVNRSREGRLRGTVDVSVDYDTDLPEAIAVAEAAMAEVDVVIDQPEPRAVGKEFASSSVVLELQFWIDDPTAQRMWTAKTDVVGAVRAAYEREGIEIPFPQRTLGAREGAGLALGEAPSARPGTDGEAGHANGDGTGNSEGRGEGDGTGTPAAPDDGREEDPAHDEAED